MSWREILHAESSDKRDKSPQSDLFNDKIPSGAPFSHFSHQNQDIKNKDLEDINSVDIPKKRTDKTDKIVVPAKPTEWGGRLAFVDHITETEREYYIDLLEIMESPKFGMDRENAEMQARVIVDEYRLRKKQRLERIEK